ncbi:MAG: GNAT family N-acetyltransferase [Candidatus Methanomethylophilaceae archaeon]|nr:GNAT family N-acetyltransferase [Candidatus Methanomethylophilaceae archaeon]MBP5394999.1 GNAT family N-acetyltransferase [Candidatus Methanomethylophilaceae archaeon]
MKTVLDNGMVLRPADADDLRYISDCIASTLKASVPDEEASLSDLWTGTTVAAALDSLSTRKMQDEAFILTDGTDRKGFLWMGISRDQYNAESVGYVLGIFVAPELRRKGIGSEMIGCAESWCRDRDLLTMQLDVGETNRAALSMYESLGYGRRSSVMTKPLK